MKFLACLGKTFKENLRDWKVLSLVLAFGPFFVYLMHAYFGAAASGYTLVAIDRDRPVTLADGRRLHAGRDLADRWRGLPAADGKPAFTVVVLADEAEGRRRLERRDADLVVRVPEDFSGRLAAWAEGRAGPLPALTNEGDASNLRFLTAAALADVVSFNYVSEVTGLRVPLDLDFRTTGAAGREPRDFDLYVPALLVLAIIMVLFSAAASIIKEVDKGTIVRLALSRLRPLEFLGAVGLNQVLISTAALGLTFLAVLHVGYRTQGSVALLFAVGALSALSVVAISLLVAAAMKTIFELLTVGTFPFFVLMFFSDCMFPLPKLALFHLAGYTFHANDVLPTALTVKAFNKVLNHGAGVADIGMELTGIVLLTAAYFAVGAWAFRRRHLKTG
ncbi:MAG: ABC transporter permease [Acidobacteria bacterium]|nr:ABC transporter permease [Acidobacteriota bacterium]